MSIKALFYIKASYSTGAIRFSFNKLDTCFLNLSLQLPLEENNYFQSLTLLALPSCPEHLQPAKGYFRAQMIHIHSLGKLWGNAT